MQFIPVPNVAQIELLYDIQGQKCENVLHYAGFNVGDPGTLQALCDSALASWGQTMKGQQSENLTLVSIKATDLTSQDGATFEYTTDLPQPGSAAGEMLPFNCALVLSLKTAKRGRSYRGRVYVPGLVETQQASSIWTAGTLTAFQSWYTYWDYLDVSGEPYALGVVSRFHNGAPRTTGVFENVTSVVVNNVVGSQRRRLPGRGR